MKRYPEPGTRIYCVGAGKHAPGTTTKLPPLTLEAYKDKELLSYRCDWNKGEHLVPLAKCRLLKPKLYKNEPQFDEDGQEVC